MLNLVLCLLNIQQSEMSGRSSKSQEIGPFAGGIFGGYQVLRLCNDVRFWSVARVLNRQEWDAEVCRITQMADLRHHCHGVIVIRP